MQINNMDDKHGIKNVFLRSKQYWSDSEIAGSTFS